MMIAEINQPSYRLISICVTVVHVLLMGMIFLFSSYSPVIDRPAPKKLVVKTITLNQKKEVITTYSPPLNKKKESKQETKPVYIKKTEVVEIPTPSMPKKAAEQAMKVTQKPKAIEKPKESPKVIPKAIPTPKKTPVKNPKVEETQPKSVKPKASPKKNSKEQEFLAKAQKSLTKIKQNADSIKAPSHTSSNIAIIQDLEINKTPEESHETMGVEARYQDEIESRLRLLLKFPAQGSVKVKITLDRSGKVVDVTLLTSENKVNSEYIKQKLPTIQFPAFGSHFKNDEQHSFVILLRNGL